MFGQVFETPDLVAVGVLIILEGVLSIDNALVLGMLARRLPKHQQARALSYGLIGAFVFRLISIATAEYLMRWQVVKLLGGLYLAYVSGKYFLFEATEEAEEEIVESPDGLPALVDAETGKPLPAASELAELEARSVVPIPDANEVATTGPGLSATPGKKYPNFWLTVGSIELTDIAFAVDSILAAIAFVGNPPAGHVGPHPKLWVVFTGGFLGVILMRFAAKIFIRLLEKFPRFEVAAYLLVLVIAGKLLVEWHFNTPDHPHAIDFHDVRGLAFWIFWGLMAASFSIGFLPKKSSAAKPPTPESSEV